MAKNRNTRELHARSSMLSRRQFIKLAATTAAAGTVSWSPARIFAAQPSRKRIVIHGERQVTSLGYHNRRETEHVQLEVVELRRALDGLRSIVTTSRRHETVRKRDTLPSGALTAAHDPIRGG